MARLIEADVLIEHLDHCIAESKGLMRSVCVAIKCFVQQMPTVDAVPAVHGRWVWTETGEEDYEQYWVCSECGEHTYFITDYCCKCGANMDLEVKDA